MNIFTNYLEKLGSNFLVAAMVPSLTFVIAGITVFDPTIQMISRFEKQGGTYQLIEFGLLVFILTVIIGFTLTALNTYILKLYEGYAFIHHVPFMYKRLLRYHKRKAENLISRREELRKQIEVLRRNVKKSPEIKRLERNLRQEYYSVTSEYDRSYPSNPEEILPTQFGNILKASEQYSGTRYGLDGVEFWPRLIQVIPKEYQQTIDNSRNELSFLVNMSMLSILFYLACFIAVFYSLYVFPVDFSNTDSFFAIAGVTVRYLAAAGLAFICSVFFYKASIYSVSSFGLMIRSAYDLFRIDLLRQYKLKIPANLKEEFYTWKDLNEFVVMGKHSLTFKKLDYDIKD